MRKVYLPIFNGIFFMLLFISCNQKEAPISQSKELVIYSGRGKNLIAPLIEKFQAKTGLHVKIRYSETNGLAAMLMEEGLNSPADIFLGQDASAMGALSKAGHFSRLPRDVFGKVDARFHAADSSWIGISGRARVIIYNTNRLKETDLPDNIFGFCDPKWKGRLGWAPSNASFQAFVTALRKVNTEGQAHNWLKCIQQNSPVMYPKNTPIVDAVGRGEIDAGFVNHYYLYKFLKDNPDFPARNYFPRSGGIGGMMNVAGVGILKTARHLENAEKFVRYLLSPEAQTYFSQETNEYPVAGNIGANSLVTPLEEIKIPQIDLNKLADLSETQKLLRKLGIL